MESKKREIKYDYLRTLLTLAVIMVHGIPEETINQRQWMFSTVLTPLLLTSVGLFFMMSGLFLLQSYKQDIRKFYWERFRGILIPFFVYSGIYYWYCNVYLSLTPRPWYEHISMFIKAFVTQTIPSGSHFWFMYVIIALYICTPFLARMLHSMTDREVKDFFIIILLIQGAATYLPALGLDVNPAMEYVIFKGWLIYFVLGYISIRLFGDKKYLPFGILGIVCFVITILQKWITPDFTPGIHDMSYPMIGMTISIFLFFHHYGNIQISFFIKAVSFISRYSFSVYMIHYLILNQVVKGLIEKTTIRHYYVPRILAETVLTFLISLTIAVLIDETIIKRLKKRSRYPKMEYRQL